MLPQQPFRIGSDLITPVLVVHDLGIHIDADVSMRSHVMKISSACFAVLRRPLGTYDCLPVTGVVSGATAPGLLQYSIGGHSITPCMALAIGNECRRTARLCVTKVRPYHATPTPITLAESSMVDILQSGHSGLQMSSWPGTIISR